jgi:hypothetical protein
MQQYLTTAWAFLTHELQMAAWWLIAGYFLCWILALIISRLLERSSSNPVIACYQAWQMVFLAHLLTVVVYGGYHLNRLKFKFSEDWAYSVIYLIIFGMSLLMFFRPFLGSSQYARFQSR